MPPKKQKQPRPPDSGGAVDQDGWRVVEPRKPRQQRQQRQRKQREPSPHVLSARAMELVLRDLRATQREQQGQDPTTVGDPAKRTRSPHASSDSEEPERARRCVPAAEEGDVSMAQAVAVGAPIPAVQQPGSAASTQIHDITVTVTVPLESDQHASLATPLSPGGNLPEDPGVASVVQGLLRDVQDLRQQVQVMAAWRSSVEPLLAQLETALQQLRALGPVPQQLDAISAQLASMVGRMAPPDAAAAPQTPMPAPAQVAAPEQQQQRQQQKPPAGQKQKRPAEHRCAQPQPCSQSARPSYAAAAAAPRRPAPGVTPGGAGAALGSGFLSSLSFRRHFLLHGPSEGLPANVKELQAFISQRLPGAHVSVIDALRLGPATAPRMLLTVASLADADAVVQHRHLLKGSGFTLFDVLSPEEHRQHARLWPRFVEARSRGLPAQFHRARLVVDGARVLPA
jgi:hypothetical protein